MAAFLAFGQTFNYPKFSEVILGLYSLSGRTSLRWRHNELDGVSDHQPHDCLLNRLFGRRLKNTWKLRVTGLCEGIHRGPVNSPHKWPITRKMFPFDDVIISYCQIAKSRNREIVLKWSYHSEMNLGSAAVRNLSNLRSKFTPGSRNFETPRDFAVRRTHVRTSSTKKQQNTTTNSVYNWGIFCVGLGLISIIYQ